MKANKLVQTLVFLGIIDGTASASTLKNIKNALSQSLTNEIREDGSIVIAAEDLSLFMSASRQDQLNVRLIDFNEKEATLKFYRQQAVTGAEGISTTEASVFGSYTCTDLAVDEQKFFVEYTCTTIDVD